MLIIGPGFLFLMFLMMFKPVRFVIGWTLFLLIVTLVCVWIYAATP